MKRKLPKFWHDDFGTVRLMMLYPIEGYVLARRPGCMVFAIAVTALQKQFKEGKGGANDR